MYPIYSEAKECNISCLQPDLEIVFDSKNSDKYSEQFPNNYLYRHLTGNKMV